MHFTSISPPSLPFPGGAALKKTTPQFSWLSCLQGRLGKESAENLFQHPATPSTPLTNKRPEGPSLSVVGNKEACSPRRLRLNFRGSACCEGDAQQRHKRISSTRNQTPFCPKGTPHSAPISYEGNTESSALSYAVFKLISLFFKNAFLILHSKWPPNDTSRFCRFLPGTSMNVIQARRGKWPWKRVHSCGGW